VWVRRAYVRNLVAESASGVQKIRRGKHAIDQPCPYRPIPAHHRSGGEPGVAIAMEARQDMGARRLVRGFTHSRSSPR